MGGKYKFTGDVTAGHIGDNYFSKKDDSQEKFETLSQELDKLKKELKKNAVTDEQDVALAEIISAKKESDNKNEEGVLKHLKNAGVWVLETAKEIGVSVVAELISKQIGK
jgi:hypothetical protein